MARAGGILGDDMNGFGAIGEFAIGEFVDWQWQFRYPVGSKPTKSLQLFFTNRDDLIEEDDMKFALFSSSVVDTVTNGALQQILTINTEDYDPEGLASVAANTITIAGTGYYRIALYVGWYPDSLDFDGTATLETSDLPTNIYYPFGYVAAWAAQYDEQSIITPMLHLASPGQVFKIKFSNALGDDQNVQVYQVGIYKYAD